MGIRQRAAKAVFVILFLGLLVGTLAAAGLAIGTPEPDIDVEVSGEHGAVSVANSGSYDLGGLHAGEAQTFHLIVRNVGEEPLVVETITTPPAVNVDVPATVSTGFTLGPGATSTVTFAYTPLVSVSGAFSFRIDISSTDPDEAVYEFTVTGTSLPADISVTDEHGLEIADGSSRDHGTIGASVPQSFVLAIQNVGVIPLNVEAVTITNKENAEASCSFGSSVSLAPVEQTVVSFSYTALAPGPFSFEIDIVSDDPDEANYDIAVTGTAAAPEIDVEGSFGPIPDGGSEDQGTFDPGIEQSFPVTIYNNGTAMLNGGPITIANKVNVDATSGFTSFTIGPDHGSIFYIYYTPLAPGPFSFEIDIVSDDADEGNYDLTITGTGGSPEIDIEGTLRPIPDGGSENQGTLEPGVQQSFPLAIYNRGEGTLHGGAITIANKANVDAASGVVSFTLGPGHGATFFIYYTPLSACPFSFEIDVVSDDADEGNYNITVYGNDDLTPPVISCPPDATVECGDSTDPAVTGEATATDDCSPANEIVIGWTDDSSEIAVCCGTGAIARTWTATDSWGNASSCDQTITVVDTTPPTITLLGPDPFIVELGAEYTDPGAQAEDVCCVDPAALVVDTSGIDESSPGSYTVAYDIDDCAGNTAATVERSVEIVDTTAPTIIIRVPEDGAEYLLHEAVLADWSVSDPSDTLTVAATAEVGAAIDTTHPGEHTFTVTATDGSGNESTIVATYFVRYRLEMDPESIPSQFEIPSGEGRRMPALLLEPLVIPYGTPIHLDFTLHDVAGVPLTEGVPTVTVIRVTRDGDFEAREILRLEFVAFDEEAGCYGHALCSSPESLLEPGLYDLWLGLGDGRNLLRRIVVQ